MREPACGAGVALISILLAGCSAVGPDYRPPEVIPPAAWHAELQAGLKADDTDSQALGRWWIRLEDPGLSELIERALAANLDILQAQARVREARARRGIAQADRFPTLAANGAASRARSSQEAGRGLTNELYSVGFDANWEIDVFGGRRRALEAAEASLQASQEDLRDVLVTLVGEIALNYVDLRSFQTRLSIAEENLAAQGEVVDLTRWRFEAGLATQLDVDQARTALEQTRAQIPTLRSGREQAKNRLAVLLGRHPGSLENALAESKAIPSVPLEIAVGVPAELLRRRPDVRRAERQLAAQTAQVGVATAALYPRFSLAGSIGLESLLSSTLLRSSARTYNAGANAAWTLFDAGRIRQNIEVQNALQEQALIRYEAAVLIALKDVEGALTAFVNEQSRRQSLRQAAQAARSALDLARNQYLAGMIDFQPVLDTQRTLLSIQDQLAVSEAEVTSDLIRLYKALGGGWTSIASGSMEPDPRPSSANP